MHKVLSFWLKRPVTLIILTVIIILLGGLSLYNLPMELSPAVEFPKATISVYYPDSTPEMIEARVTAPIESRMQEIADIRKLESVSNNNYSRISLQFDRKADMAFNLFRINEILSDYKTWLPAGVLRPSLHKYIPDEFKQTSFLSYRLLTAIPESSLYNLVEEKIKRPLQNISGVATVDVFGLRTPQVQILLDITKMKEYGISLHDIRDKMKGVKVHVGLIKNKQNRLPVSVDYSFDSLESLNNISFKLSASRSIFFKDIASISEDYRKLRYKKRINGNHTILITLQKESGANTISVADKVFDTVIKIQENLPHGNTLLLVNDSSAELRQAIYDLSLRTIIALFAIFFLLLIILKRFSYTFIILLSISLSVLAVFLFLYLFNYSINLLTLAGLALGFGFMVDNAIIVFDNIEGRQTSADVVSYALKVIFPIFASTLTTLAALTPFIFLSQELQIYYIPFAVVVSAALLASVIFAFLFVPPAYWHIQKKRFYSSKKSILIFLENPYQKFLLFSLKFRKLIILITLWLFGFPLWLLPVSFEEDVNDPALTGFFVSVYNNTLGSEWYSSVRKYSDPALGGAAYLFFKYVERGEPWHWGGDTYLMVYISMPQGSDFGLSEKIILDFEQIALSENDAVKVETTISSSSAYMRIDFPEETAYSALPFILKGKLIYRATKVGGAYISVSGYGDAFASGFSSSISNFRLKLKGYNYLELKNFALKLQAELEKNRRVRNVDINTPFFYRLGDLYELEMNINWQSLAYLDLKPSDVIPLLNLYTSETLSAYKIKIGFKEKYLNIKSKEFHDLQLDHLSAKWFEPAGTQPFRLGQLATITKKKTLPEIRRENQEYIRHLSFDFFGHYLFGKEYLDQILKKFHLPVGYSVEHQFFTWQEVEEENLIFVILLGLLFIYMVTASLYESFRIPFLIFLTIPAGLIGIFFTFYLTDTIFNRSAYIGVLFISGIVVNNSIILISKFKNIQKEGVNLLDIVIKGGLSHLRPLFLTSSTTILGFLPMIFLAENKAGDLWYTLALTGISGILSSFIFILIILPLLFYTLESRKSNPST